MTVSPLRGATLVDVQEEHGQWVIARWETPAGDTAWEVTYATLDVPLDARRRLPVDADAEPLGVVRRSNGLLLGIEGPERTAVYVARRSGNV